MCRYVGCFVEVFFKEGIGQVDPSGSQKRPWFSQRRPAEKNIPGSTPVAPVPVAPPPVSIVDLEVALDSLPSFDECIEHLPLYNAEGSSKGKEKIAPLLAEEVEAVGHLRSIVSEQDLKSLWPNSTEALARSTLFDVGRASVLFFLFLWIVFPLLALLNLLVAGADQGDDPSQPSTRN